jgi:hypothetical protein
MTTTPSVLPISPYDGTDLARIRSGALQMLGLSAMPGTALHLAPFHVPETAIHDFAQYVFLRDPNALLGADYSVAPPGDLNQFLQEAVNVIRWVVENFCADQIDTGTYRIQNLVPHFPEFEAIAYQLFLTNIGGTLYEFAGRIPGGYQGSSGSVRTDVLCAFSEWCTALVTSAHFDPNTLAASFDNPALWINSPAQVEQIFQAMFPGAQVDAFIGSGEPDYSFSPFPSDLVNVGLRLVFRQEWRPLGTQPGEIVRTIPLGPKQSEKVSTKVVVTQRESRTADSFVSTETSTEASNVTRESNDVVEEASSSLKWHVDAEASASMGFFSAKLSAGVAGETANSSKESKSRLNETMQKTASKMRRDMKVVVSTERTSTEEAVHTSEIVNPNDEIAITYVYSKLQRQYEIQTTLAEVNSVVFIPEPIPRWKDITTEWIRRHDWILAPVVLDPTFAADLAELAREPDEPGIDDGNASSTAAANASTAISDYKTFPGGALPDLFSALQATHHQHLERKHGIAMNQSRRSQRNTRLVEHIQQNILHYMRAIWAAEDADQRLRRYARILVPTRWTFVPSGPIDPAHPELEVPGEFLPDLGPESIRPLSEILNPAGPIGYTGNYAVYYLRGDPRLLDLYGALNHLRAQYVRFIVEVQNAGVNVRQAVAIEPRYRETIYKLTYQAPNAWKVIHQATGTDIVVKAADGDTNLSFDGLKILLEAAPPVGQVITVELTATGELEDPELRLLRATTPLPATAKEAVFFNNDLLLDIASFVPQIGISMPSDLSGGWAKLPAALQQAIRDSYHLYLLLKEHTRRFVLETNNLVLDLDVGQTPALEEFKRLHRVVDVLKEIEETARRGLDNARRDERLKLNDLADPDIEQVTVVGSAAELRTSVGPVITTQPAAVSPAPATSGGGNQ